MESIYTVGTSSASHTYGNVAACLKEMILSYFPKNFFTYAYVDSKIAWKNINEVLGNGDREFVIRHYPFLIITPRFNENEDDVFLANTPLVSNMDNAEAGGLQRNTLFPIIIDKEHQIHLCYKLNRDRIDFDLELRMKTLAQQLDVYKNMKNQMLWDRPHVRQIALESMIPRSMIEYIGKLAGIDISRSNGTSQQVPLIMRYLNAHSRLPITYKMRNSTSVDEFFAYYKANMLLTFTDLRRDTGTKKNMVDDYFPITFHITAEFNLPGLYVLTGSNERKYHGMKFDALVESPSGSDLIPMYTYTNLYDRYVTDTMDGFTFYSSTIVQTDEENQGNDDIVDIRDLIPPDHMKVLDSYVENGVAPETLFRFRLLSNSNELDCNCETKEEHDWDINWIKRELVIHHSDPMATYRIIIYANMVHLNSRYGDMQDKTKTDMTLR